MRLILATLLLCSSHAFAAPATPVAESGGLLLAQDSKALQMIVVSSAASAELKATAKELAEILGRVSGGTFDIQVGDGSAGIVLGRLENFPVAGLEKAFHEAVNDYMKACAALGQSPNKPVSGNMMLRVPTDVHASAIQAAELAGVSLNQWAANALRTAAQH